MTKFMLAAGAAALAIVSPALAQKGGQGGEKERGGGHSAKVDRSGGGQKADRGNRGGGHAQIKHEVRGSDRVKSARIDLQGRGNDKSRVAKGDQGARGKGVVRIDRADNIGRNLRSARFDRDNDGVRFVPRWNENGLVRGFVDGCPPGLARKGNGCMPPGQAKKLVGTPLPAALSSRMLAGQYRSWYRDNDDYFYRWDDDYIYRVNRGDNLISALFPYQNRDYYYYPTGMQYPGDYNYYNVPFQYQSYYPDNGANWYRYGDGAIYQVNPSSGMIQGIAALLTGDPFAVGQPLPAGYGAYNVPFAYRDRYYDSPNDWYRYNDGYIYRVDPTTQLVTAVISAIV